MNPTLWINDLDLEPIAEALAWPVLYDVTDDWLLDSTPERIRNRRSEKERRLLALADEVVVCSAQLAKSKGRSREVTTISNGVDLERFSAPAIRPADMPDSPTAVYVGTLHTDRFDVDLVRSTAARSPDVQFVLVGPILFPSSDRLRLDLPNVHVLGPRPYEDVPAYLAHATVCIVPHVITPFTESLDPIKAYECLAIGRPTLATAVAGFRDLGDPIVVAARDQFSDRLKEMLAMNKPSRPRGDIPTWRGQAALFDAALDRATVAAQRNHSSEASR